MNVHAKVIASASTATVAGAAATLGFYLLSIYGINVPQPVADSTVTLLAALLGFVGGYLTPSPPKGP